MWGKKLDPCVGDDAQSFLGSNILFMPLLCALWLAGFFCFEFVIDWFGIGHGENGLLGEMRRVVGSWEMWWWFGEDGGKMWCEKVLIAELWSRIITKHFIGPYQSCMRGWFILEPITNENLYHKQYDECCWGRGFGGCGENIDERWSIEDELLCWFDYWNGPLISVTIGLWTTSTSPSKIDPM